MRRPHPYDLHHAPSPPACAAQFAALVKPLHDNSVAALRAAFDQFDLDKSGDIDRSELSMMLRKLGFAWQGAHVFEAADLDGDGKVDFEEFLACFGQAAAGAKDKIKPAAKGKAAPAKGKAAPAAPSTKPSKRAKK